jgi:2-phospho-L-lactate guanylyltransferase (CobY/MobA/RfbA family)
MKFPGYFLIVADFIKWAKNQDIPVGPGRGSGAGSLVAYALTITDVDPLRFGCCSSASSIPNASRCPTSTSTSARIGAKR